MYVVHMFFTFGIILRTYFNHSSVIFYDIMMMEPHLTVRTITTLKINNGIRQIYFFGKNGMR
jgi:hypothetical protein